MSFLLSMFVLLFLLALVVIAILWSQLTKQHKEFTANADQLKNQIAQAKTVVITEENKLKNVQGTTEYEKYAGLAVTQLDRGIVIIDQNRTIRLINNYAKQYLDLAAGVGVPYKEAIHLRSAATSDDSSLFEKAFLGSSVSLPDSVSLVSAHGTFPVGGTIAPIDGHIVFIFQDISTEVTRVKEEQAFFSAAAHELRTPLTVIRMTVSLLKDKLETLPKEKIVEHLRRADETSERLVRLVNEFLNVSRIDQGRLEMNIEKIDIVTLTDDVIKDLMLLAKERNLYIHHNTDVESRQVLADPAKSTEVLSNLISNGLKYTIQGGVTIAHTIEGTMLVTTVTDTGPGIPHEFQSLLFKRFGQVGAARELAPTKSSGLGLYISKKFAQLMHGDVVLLKSEPGAGSTFAFQLPLR